MGRVNAIVGVKRLGQSLLAYRNGAICWKAGGASLCCPRDRCVMAILLAYRKGVARPALIPRRESMSIG